MSVPTRDPARAQTPGSSSRFRNTETCFTCHEPEHKSFECPKKRLNLLENYGEDDELFEGDLERAHNTDDEDALRDLEETKRHVGVMRCLFTNSKEDD